MKKNQNGSGLAIAALVLLIVALLGFVAWRVYAQNSKNTSVSTSAKPEGKPSNLVSTKTDGSLISDATLAYCQTDYKKVWQTNSDVAISDDSITAKADSPIVENSYARVPNASCSTTKLAKENQFSGFTAYYKKNNGKWVLYTTDQQTPACDKFDGGGWPSQVVPECYGSNNELRAVKQ